ncbi:uncharacterized protein MAM_04314 [Metarhizium album ARSEF 1941]|uniref:Uncharacterized protein n=1 Tax=Metarhizium album (strain ARSEF 1941) TaxID=1081103 RepID=A0A0B2WYK0_METAS|nr:uncharacterized protein MAM_04314 [Metarhizium album ARSEF 1941]KHN97925.1 hypothetical protein MAM_04314 [Metarhizium album ARSEF 1941]
MALLNPVYALVVPFLFVVTVPLAILAGITTTLAFDVLILRVVIVYLDVALSLVPQSLANIKLRQRYITREARMPPAFRNGYGSSNGDSSAASPTQQPPISHLRRRHRPSSSLSILSTGGSTTPVGEFGIGLMPSVGPDRDFEGVGGWRSGDDDEVWTAINSRMELPDRQFPRHHYRSPSGGGATTPGDGGVLMMKTRRRSSESKAGVRPASSPNSSRARTPSASRMQSMTTLGSGNSDSYFPFIMSPKASRKMQL